MGSILVTGGAGYIGSHAVLALRDAGFAPVVLDDLSTGFRQAVPADVPFVQGSVGDEDLMAETMLPAAPVTTATRPGSSANACGPGSAGKGCSSRPTVHRASPP